MSPPRLAVLLATLLLALAAGACGDDDDGGGEPAGGSGAAATPAGRPVREGPARPQAAGHADHRHRQARLPALLREQRAQQRARLRERGGLRRGRRARLQQRRGQVDHGAVQRLLCARAEEVRLRHQPDLHHAAARRARGLLGAVLHRAAGGDRLEVLRRRARGGPRGPEGRPARRRRSGRRASRRSSRRSRPSTTRRCSTTPTTRCARSRPSAWTRSSSTCRRPSSSPRSRCPEATIVGQFAAPGGDDWGLLLEKGSALTPCVNEALATLREDGTLADLQDEYMGGNVAPELR